MSNYKSYRLIDSVCECGDQAASGCNSKCPLCYWEDESDRLYSEIEAALKILLNKNRVEYAQRYDLVETVTEAMEKLKTTQEVLIQACKDIAGEGYDKYADELLRAAGL